MINRIFKNYHLVLYFITFVFSSGSIANENIIKIGMPNILDGNAPEQKDIGGFLLDYWSQWAEEINVTAEFKFLPYPILKQELIDGKIDMLVTYPANEHYDLRLVTSLPYIKLSGVLYERLSKKHDGKILLNIPENVIPANFDKHDSVATHSPNLEDIMPTIDDSNYIYTFYADELKSVLEKKFAEVFELSNEIDPGIKFSVATTKKNKELLDLVNSTFINSSFSEQIASWYKYFPSGSNYYSLLFGSYDPNLPSRYIELSSSLPTLKYAYIKKGDAPRYIDDGFFVDGYLVNILKQISNITGIEFKPVGYDDFNSAYQGLKNRDVDVFPGLIKSPERNYLVFSNPIGNYVSAIVSQEGFNIADELRNLTVSQIRGYAYNNLFKEIETVSTYTVDSLEEAVQAVSSGKADAYVGDIFDVSYQVARGKLENLEVRKASSQSYDLPYRIAFTKNYQDALGLINYAIFKSGQKLQRESQSRWKQQIHSLNTEHKVRVAEIETWKKAIYVFTVLFMFFIVYWYYAKKRIALEKALDQVTHQKVRAETLALAKSDFLARMSHEIRTPMNGVIGMAEALGYSSLDEKQKGQLKVLSTSAHGLMSLLNYILDYSKLDADKLELDIKPYDIDSYIKQVVINFSQAAEDNQNELNLTIDEDLVHYYLFDSVRLMQILNNLLSNAIKFTRKGIVDINVVLVDRQEEYDRIAIYVKDTGIGIKDSTLPNLFDPFTQAEASTTREFGGTGLGLTICKDLISAMNGHISVSSIYGFGTQFKVVLPLVRSHLKRETGVVGLNEKPQELLDNVKSLPLAGNIRLLVVEDSNINIDVIRSQLDILTISCDYAENGSVAISMWSKRHYDVVLSDCHMPVMDGFELASVLSSQKQPPYLIALTADILPKTIERCMNSGFNAYLSKPCDLESLRDELTKSLEWLNLNGHEGTNSQQMLVENCVVNEAAKKPQKTTYSLRREEEKHTRLMFNLKHIRAMCGGDEDIVIRLLHSFVDKVQLELAVYDNDKQTAAEFKDLFHKLKGTFLYLGEDEAVRKIEGIEKRSSEYTVDELNEEFDFILAHLKNIVGQIKGYLDDK